MDEAKKLRRGAIFVQRGEECPEIALVMLSAADELERLTPKAMTLEECRGLFNTHQYLGLRWRLASNARRQWLWGVDSDPRHVRVVSEFEAKAIARALASEILTEDVEEIAS